MPLLINAIGGRYSATLNAVSLGITDEGYRLFKALKQEEIAGSDAYGDALLDYFYRGGDVTIQADSKEYAAGATNAFWQWGAIGQMTGTGSPIGRLASAVAQALVLTSTPATPAAATPATLTAPNAVLAPGQNGSLLFNSKLRRVPIFLAALPYTSGSSVLWFATT